MTSNVPVPRPMCVPRVCPGGTPAEHGEGEPLLRPRSAKKAKKLTEGRDLDERRPRQTPGAAFRRLPCGPRGAAQSPHPLVTIGSRGTALCLVRVLPEVVVGGVGDLGHGSCRCRVAVCGGGVWPPVVAIRWMLVVFPSRPGVVEAADSRKRRRGRAGASGSELNRRDLGYRPAATGPSGIPVRSPATSMSTSKSVCATRSKESPADA